MLSIYKQCFKTYLDQAKEFTNLRKLLKVYKWQMDIYLIDPSNKPISVSCESPVSINLVNVSLCHAIQMNFQLDNFSLKLEKTFYWVRCYVVMALFQRLFSTTL